MSLLNSSSHVESGYPGWAPSILTQIIVSRSCIVPVTFFRIHCSGQCFGSGFIGSDPDLAHFRRNTDPDPDPGF
jgi:hypothetical protein